MPNHAISCFNIRNMRRWYKPMLFSLGILTAGLIAINPKFVLPYKYYFSEVTPAVIKITPTEMSDELDNLPTEMADESDELESLEPATPLPDTFTSTSENKSAVEKSASLNDTSGVDEVVGAVAGTSKISTNSSHLFWIEGNFSIPSLKISAPLIYVADRTKENFQLGLQHGVVQYPGTALPGQLGNMYIFGHSSDYSWAKGSYKTVFAKLPDIKIGDEIKVTDSVGKVYTYKVTSTVIALPDETKYLSQHNYQKKLLTVQTSYPIGTALKRFLAIAELVE